MDLVSHPPQIAWANTWPFRSQEETSGSWSESDHLVAVLDGRGTLQVAERRVALDHGDALVVPWGIPVRYGSPGGRLSVVSVHLVRTAWDAPLPEKPVHSHPEGFPPRERRLPAFGLPTDPIPRGTVPGLIDLMLAAAEAWSGAGDHRAARLRGIALCLVTGLLAVRRPEREDSISALVTWLGFNYMNRIGRFDLERRTGLGRTVLGERFRERTGRSPMGYVQHLRMTEARRLIEHTDLPIAVVAATVGIPDPAYFSRLFVQATGVAPSRLRRTGV